MSNPDAIETQGAQPSKPTLGLSDFDELANLHSSPVVMARASFNFPGGAVDLNNGVDVRYPGGEVRVNGSRVNVDHPAGTVDVRRGDGQAGIVRTANDQQMSAALDKLSQNDLRGFSTQVFAMSNDSFTALQQHLRSRDIYLSRNTRDSNFPSLQIADKNQRGNWQGIEVMIDRRQNNFHFYDFSKPETGGKPIRGRVHTEPESAGIFSRINSRLGRSVRT